MQKKIKVLMFIDALVSGGKERRMVELLKGIGERGDIQCEVAVMQEEIHYKEIFDLGIPVHYLIRKTKKDPLILINLYRLCKKIKPDVIHVWDSMTAIYAAPITKLLGIKFINAMITDAPSKLGSDLKNRSKISALFADIMLANSNAGLKAYQITAKKGRYIHNGFSANRVKKLENVELIKKRFELNCEKIIGMVGAIQERKDYKTFIEAAIIILEEKTNICFLIVGDGPLRKSMEDLIPQKHKSRIIFLGKQNNVESFINIFNIGVLTTNQPKFGEGISNAILEYMALGKPVIATNGGGTPEIVENGVTGYLVQESSAEDLKEKILILLNNESLSLSMGEAGKKKVLTEFSLEKMVNKTLELYKEILN